MNVFVLFGLRSASLSSESDPLLHLELAETKRAMLHVHRSQSLAVCFGLLKFNVTDDNDKKRTCHQSKTHKLVS